MGIRGLQTTLVLFVVTTQLLNISQATLPPNSSSLLADQTDKTDQSRPLADATGTLQLPLRRRTSQFNNSINSNSNTQFKTIGLNSDGVHSLVMINDEVTKSEQQTPLRILSSQIQRQQPAQKKEIASQEAASASAAEEFDGDLGFLSEPTNNDNDRGTDDVVVDYDDYYTDEENDDQSQPQFLSDYTQRAYAYAALNNFFETELEVGSEKQRIKFVIDTGSSWTWLTFDKCTHKYAQQQSEEQENDGDNQNQSDKEFTDKQVEKDRKSEVEKLDDLKQDSDIDQVISSIFQKGKLKEPTQDNEINDIWNDILGVFGYKTQDNGRRNLQTKTTEDFVNTLKEQTPEDFVSRQQKVCTSTETDIYHPVDSDTSSWQNSNRQIHYAQHVIKGRIAQDSFTTTTTNQKSIPAFEFLAVDIEDAPRVDGVELTGLLGLSTADFSTKTFTSNLDPALNGPLFMNWLFLEKQVEKNRFSILLTYDSMQESYLTFGGIPNFVSSLDQAVSHRVATNDHWTLKLMDLRVGRKSINPVVNFALTDTGTSLIYLDQKDYKALISAICDSLECYPTKYDANVYAIEDCKPDDLPTIWVQLDLHDYKLAPHAYIVALHHENGDHECIIQFRQNARDTGYMVLGVLFLQNYFQIYDVNMSQLSLLPLGGNSGITMPDGQKVTGYGQVMMSNTFDVELEQTMEYGLNSALLFVSLLLSAFFGYRFAKVESAEPEYAVAH